VLPSSLLYLVQTEVGRNYPRPISEFFHAACQIRKSLNP
jgi:hypothetical protein